MIRRDKQIELMRAAAERKDSPLQAWIARSEVKCIMELDPDIIRQEANSDVKKRSDMPRQDGGGTMMLACA